MKSLTRHVSTWIGLVTVAAWVAAVPVSAQDRATASPPSGGGSSASAPSGGGGGSTSSGGGGGDRASAGGGGSFSGGGSNRADAGGYGGATGGSGVAMPRSEYSRDGGSRSSAGAAGRTEFGARGRSMDGDDRAGVPQFSRPRDGEAQVGTAIPRPAGSRPSTGSGGANYVVVPGGYYGGYSYYPGAYGGFYNWYYDPFYDPWYGGYYSTYAYPQSSGYSYGFDDGSLRLKIKPRDAQVYVDGYYVGIVDEFDGLFQRLHIESGVHRIEVRADGYETLVFEVKITPEHKTTYEGEMKRIQ